MFSDDDPVLARVRRAALALPGAAEKISHGRPAFFTSKVFAYYGGSVKVDGVYVQHPQSVMVRLDAEDHAVLLAEPRSFVPAYLGASGWLGLDLLPTDGGEPSGPSSPSGWTPPTGSLPRSGWSPSSTPAPVAAEAQADGAACARRTYGATGESCSTSGSASSRSRCPAREIRPARTAESSSSRPSQTS